MIEKIFEAFHVAFANLKANAVRSFLSILGIVIGISAVILVLAFGATARQEILERVNTLGVNVYTVYPTYDEKTRRMGNLEFADIERLQSLSFVVSAFPNLMLYKEVRSRSAVQRASVRGVDHNYKQAGRLIVSHGRFFTPIELEKRAYVCVISEDGSDSLFPNGIELGQPLFIDGTPWEIIGVSAARWKKETFKHRKFNQLDILVPHTTLLRSSKDVQLSNIEVHARPDYEGNVVAELIAAMEREDPNRKDMFRIQDQQEFLQKRVEIEKTLYVTGALVAGISLIVGGIGMMNVMLTSVAERTREIGIRRAVGARRKDVLIQFLVESCVLSGLGGFLGLVLGAALAQLVPLFLNDLFNKSPEIRPAALFVSVGCGIILGMAFGIYPAVKASHLSPAEALRTE